MPTHKPSASPTTHKPSASPTHKPTAAGRRSLVDSVPAPLNYSVAATVVDNLDGTYSYVFQTTDSGTYDAHLYFGVGCFNNGTSSSGLNATGVSDPTICFSTVVGSVAMFLPTTRSPTYGDDTPPAALPQSAITGIGVAAGIISFVGFLAIIFGIRVRNR